MKNEYIQALEKRAAWIKWAQTQGYDVWGRMDRSRYFHDHFNTSWLKVLPLYQHALQHADPYFMNGPFCQFVDDARQTIPDDLAFDPSWMQTPTGFMWIEQPFLVPKDVDFEQWDKVQDKIHDAHDADVIPPSPLKDIEVPTKAQMDAMNPEQRKQEVLRLRAALKFAQSRKDVVDTEVQGLTQVVNRLAEWKDHGGVRVSAMAWFEAGERQGYAGRKSYEILFFQDFQLFDPNAVGFGCWSYFGVSEGDKVIDRIHQFEDKAKEVGGWYRNTRESDMNHEIRWAYASLFLMSQKLATHLPEHIQRNVRRRHIHEKIFLPETFKVVTLRRYEEARAKAQSEGKAIEWNWQWLVGHHGRWQWYPKEGIHKYIMIDDYVKGPADKPMKPPSAKFYIARR